MNTQSQLLKLGTLQYQLKHKNKFSSKQGLNNIVYQVNHTISSYSLSERFIIQRITTIYKI